MLIYWCVRLKVPLFVIIFAYIIILRLACLKFLGPCILIYFYSKTNHMHNISNLFYFGTTLYMFRTVFSSIIRSLRLYIQQQIYVIKFCGCLLAGTRWISISFPLASSHSTCMTYTWCSMYSLRLLMMDKKPSEACTVLFKNKVNLRYCAYGWFYYKKKYLTCFWISFIRRFMCL